MNAFSLIKQQVSILDVVSQYATLKKVGYYFKGTCPFHTEKTASFTVSPHKNIFYCFGCHTGGDVIEFIAKVEHCSPFEAVQMLADQYKISLPEKMSPSKGPDRTQSHEEKTRYHALHQMLCSLFHSLLLKSPAVLQYLKNRGIQEQMIITHQIGYFPPGAHGVQQVITALKKSSFLVEDLIKVGIIQETKNMPFSPFENRVMFPITDHMGRIYGFGGRVFVGGDERAKYYNSRENEYFTKGHLLFGLDRAKAAMQKEDSVFIVEGYLDCMAMMQHGYGATVATMGTACTIEQLRLIARYVNHIYAAYDGDAAGQRAMVRMASLCWELGLELHIIPLPPTEDPASWLAKKGTLEEAIAQSKDIFSYLIEKNSAGFSAKAVKEKIEAIKEVLDAIAHLQDPFKKDLILQQAAQQFAISVETLKQEYQRMLKNSSKKELPESAVSVATPALPPLIDSAETLTILEKKLFSVIINHMDILEPEDETYVRTYLSEPLKTIYIKIKEATLHNADHGGDRMSLLPADEKLLVHKLLIEYGDTVEKNDLPMLLMQFQKRQWKTIVAQTKERLQHATMAQNTQEVESIIQTFQELRRTLLRKGLI
ncbi:MAG: DNA primase [Candidatus Babeliales bacterium]